MPIKINEMAIDCLIVLRVIAKNWRPTNKIVDKITSLEFLYINQKKTGYVKNATNIRRILESLEKRLKNLMR